MPRAAPGGTGVEASWSMTKPGTTPASDRVFKIGISGSYGGLNLGDEAILQSIVAQLRAAVPCEITVFSRDANDDAATIYLREVALAQENHVPVLVYAVSAGPLHNEASRTLVRDTLSRVDAVTVRERRARQLLEEVGVREIEVTADPAFLLEPDPLPVEALQREGLNENRRLIGLSVREPGSAAPDIDETHYHALLANAADYMVDRLEADLVFVPMEPRQEDTQHCHAVVSRMAHAHRAPVLRGEYTSGQLLSLMSHFDFAVGMRLHFLIFAALSRVPFVALPYSSKVAGFLEDLEIAMPPLKQVNAGQLIAYID